MRYRLILPKRLENEPLPKVIEKDDREFDSKEAFDEWLKEKNDRGYNIYYFPNQPEKVLYKNLSAKDVDKFDWVFVDMDLKDQYYKSKKEFAEVIKKFPLKPTKTIDSGHGVHVYWQISDLDRQSYMELQKALINRFVTDESIWTICQLMRVAGYKNTKYEDEVLVARQSTDKDLSSGNVYTTAEMWDNLQQISEKDARDIKAHINKYIFGISIKPENKVLEPLPEKFEDLLEYNSDLYELFYNPKDRSVADMKIANVLFFNGFSKEEALNILLQTSKGKERGISYAQPIIQKIYVDNPPDVLDEEYNEALKIANLQRTLEKKQLEIKTYKINREHELVTKAKETEKKQGSYTIKGTKSERVKYYIQQKKKEDESMQNALPCVTENLSKVVPLYGKEFILIGAETGAGKSSAAANIVFPIIDLGKRVLYISTEEKAEDIYTRVACIKNGWNFANERNWDAVQRAKRDAEITQLVEEDKLVIIDTYTPGKDRTYGYRVMPPDMTTLEGLQTAMESVEKDGENFDLVIIDYISKVGTSSKYTNMQEWQVIWNATKYVEEWSKRIGVPTVMFTQLKPNESVEKEKPFKLRLPGSQRITTLVTCAIEIKTDYESKSSIWICHKARKGIMFRKTLRFDRGKFVDNPNPLDTKENIVEDE